MSKKKSKIVYANFSMLTKFTVFGHDSHKQGHYCNKVHEKIKLTNIFLF